MSNLPFLIKLLERVVVERLLEHTDQLDMHETFQSAYRPHHSTETALLRVQDDIASVLDKNRGVLLAMIDLSAAFDTIDHCSFTALFPHKYGVDGTALGWFQSYLAGRLLCVRVGDHRSDPQTLSCGVPQGSVLGPVVFNLYTTPLEQIVHRHKLRYHKYADDMQIYGEVDPKSVFDQLRVQSQLESCLAEVRAWMLKNMLKINDEKTEFILFINPQQARFVTEASITLGGAAIKATKTVRNLGVVMMNSHLDASDKVSAIVRSCNHHLRRIARVRQYISDEACKLAVLALVISRLDYCNGLLAGAMEQKYDKLQRIQNLAARLVVRQRVAHGQTLYLMPVLQRLHWLPVRQRVIYKLCLQVFKCLHGTAPSYLLQLLHLHTRDRRLLQL